MKYNKLVRDKIPEIIRENGQYPVTHKANPEEYKVKLYEKLKEEVEEFSRQPSMDELADILEVLDTIRNFHLYDLSEVRRIMSNKLEKRGGFYGRIILDEVLD